LRCGDRAQALGRAVLRVISAFPLASDSKCDQLPSTRVVFWHVPLWVRSSLFISSVRLDPRASRLLRSWWTGYWGRAGDGCTDSVATGEDFGEALCWTRMMRSMPLLCRSPECGKGGIALTGVDVILLFSLVQQPGLSTVWLWSMLLCRGSVKAGEDKANLRS
jgi:hypothetical protein